MRFSRLFAAFRSRTFVGQAARSFLVVAACAVVIVLLHRMLEERSSRIRAARANAAMASFLSDAVIQAQETLRGKQALLQSIEALIPTRRVAATRMRSELLAASTGPLGSAPKVELGAAGSAVIPREDGAGEGIEEVSFSLQGTATAERLREMLDRLRRFPLLLRITSVTLMIPPGATEGVDQNAAIEGSATINGMFFVRP